MQSRDSYQKSAMTSTIFNCDRQHFPCQSQILVGHIGLTVRRASAKKVPRQRGIICVCLTPAQILPSSYKIQLPVCCHNVQAVLQCKGSSMITLLASLWQDQGTFISGKMLAVVCSFLSWSAILIWSANYGSNCAWLQWPPTLAPLRLHLLDHQTSKFSCCPTIMYESCGFLSFRYAALLYDAKNHMKAIWQHSEW